MSKYDSCPDFCEWYQLYPNKKAKPVAFKAWHKQKGKPSLAIMLEVLQDQIDNEIMWKRGFIPMPATYLNQERYDDEITTAPTVTRQNPIDRAKSAIQSRLNGSSMDALTGTLW